MRRLKLFCKIFVHFLDLFLCNVTHTSICIVRRLKLFCKIFVHFLDLFLCNTFYVVSSARTSVVISVIRSQHKKNILFVKTLCSTRLAKTAFFKCSPAMKEDCGQCVPWHFVPATERRVV